MNWILPLIIVILVGLVYWWYRRRKRTRMVSFVALLKEPETFDPAILAHLASKVWKADLGEGDNEGADGFVVTTDIISTIFCRGRMFMINSFPTPYTEDVEQVASRIADMRISDLFREHRAWFSCDAMGIDGTTSEQEVRDWYQQIGKLFAELLDDNCLLIFLPDTNLAFPINEDTEQALQSEDPVNELMETLSVPIAEVSSEDPAMQKAEATARERWPEFLEAYENNTGGNFSVKSPITRNGNTEFIWIMVTAIEGEKIYGELGNDPHNLGNLTLGSKVAVEIAELNDWGYIDEKGEFTGGFTIEAAQAAMKKPRKR